VARYGAQEQSGDAYAGQEEFGNRQATPVWRKDVALSSISLYVFSPAAGSRQSAGTMSIAKSGNS
jgi:hypothetical protein